MDWAIFWSLYSVHTSSRRFPLHSTDGGELPVSLSCEGELVQLALAVPCLLHIRSKTPLPPCFTVASSCAYSFPSDYNQSCNKW